MIDEYNYIPQPEMPETGYGMGLSIESIREKAKLQFQLQKAEEGKMAVGYYNVLMDYIREFEKSLADDETVAIKLASFGQSITIAVESLGYHNPGTICFYGTHDGNRVQLIQHMHQVHFLLVAVKTSDSVPRMRIGFKPDEI